MKLFCQFTLSCLLCGSQLTTSFAQKLAEMQTGGLRAPTAVKIDGKLDEWESLPAYNKRVNVYYKIANDERNLYLVIKSDNSIITSKIMQGGISFSVSTFGKNEKDAVTVIYPVIGDKEVQAMLKDYPVGRESSGARISANEIKEEHLRRDKVIAETNRKAIRQFKFLKVAGVKEITEKQLPIYNGDDIQVAAAVDVEGAYNYELALPLKYLHLPSATATINYNIKLLAKHVLTGMVIMPIQTANGGPPLGPGGVDKRTMFVDTDFWGEYVLMK